MKEIVWIVGASAVGKRTFINKLLKDKALRKRFELGDSIDDIDCISKNFATIQNEVAKSTSDSILIKWQYKDREGVEILKTRYPDKRHRIFFLWCPYDLHFERFTNKHPHRIKSFEHDRNTNNGLFQEYLAKAIHVKIINSGEDGYPELESTPPNWA